MIRVGLANDHRLAEDSAEVLAFSPVHGVHIRDASTLDGDQKITNGQAWIALFDLPRSSCGVIEELLSVANLVTLVAARDCGEAVPDPPDGFLPRGEELGNATGIGYGAAAVRP